MKTSNIFEKRIKSNRTSLKHFQRNHMSSKIRKLVKMSVSTVNQIFKLGVKAALPE